MGLPLLLIALICLCRGGEGPHSGDQFDTWVNVTAASGGTFIFCSFIGCSGDELDGGSALCFDGSEGSLRVDSCSFRECSSESTEPWSGAIICRLISAFIVKTGCTFADCRASEFSETIYVYSTSSCFYIHSSNVTGGNGGDGGGLYLSRCPSKMISETCNDEGVENRTQGMRWNVFVSDCHSSLTGGGIRLNYLQPGFSVSNCQISTCSAKLYGGGLYLFVNKEYSDYKTCFGHVYFDDNSAQGTGGHDIFSHNTINNPFPRLGLVFAQDSGNNQRGQVWESRDCYTATIDGTVKNCTFKTCTAAGCSANWVISAIVPNIEAQTCCTWDNFLCNGVLTSIYAFEPSL